MTVLNSHFAVQRFNSEIVDFVKAVISEPFFCYLIPIYRGRLGLKVGVPFLGLGYVKW